MLNNVDLLPSDPLQALAIEIKEMKRELDALKVNQDPGLVGVTGGYGSFKIVSSGSGTLTVASPGGAGSYLLLATIPHTLGYIPSILAFGAVDYTGPSNPAIPITHNAVAYSVPAVDAISGVTFYEPLGFFYVAATSTNIYIGIDFADKANTAASFNGDVLSYSYYLLKQPAR